MSYRFRQESARLLRCTQNLFEKEQTASTAGFLTHLLLPKWHEPAVDDHFLNVLCWVQMSFRSGQKPLQGWGLAGAEYKWRKNWTGSCNRLKQTPEKTSSQRAKSPTNIKQDKQERRGEKKMKCHPCTDCGRNKEAISAVSTHAADP